MTSADAGSAARSTRMRTRTRIRLILATGYWGGKVTIVLRFLATRLGNYEGKAGFVENGWVRIVAVCARGLGARGRISARLPLNHQRPLRAHPYRRPRSPTGLSHSGRLD